ncbi:hypothetical protein FDECE_16484 [Fusarium decemcellulare]|nr:hypothetical protein FDECE_16484 [Fusarium decemcellulare]
MSRRSLLPKPLPDISSREQLQAPTRQVVSLPTASQHPVVHPTEQQPINERALHAFTSVLSNDSTPEQAATHLESHLATHPPQVQQSLLQELARQAPVGNHIYRHAKQLNKREGSQTLREKAAKNRLDNIAWLNEQWSGPHWLPPDVREGLSCVGLKEPPADVVKALTTITRLANAKAIDLHLLWTDAGALRRAVLRACAAKVYPGRQSKPHLTAKTARAVAKGIRAGSVVPVINTPGDSLARSPEDIVYHSGSAGSRLDNDDDDDDDDDDGGLFGDHSTTSSIAGSPEDITGGSVSAGPGLDLNDSSVAESHKDTASDTSSVELGLGLDGNDGEVFGDSSLVGSSGNMTCDTAHTGPSLEMEDGSIIGSPEHTAYHTTSTGSHSGLDNRPVTSPREHAPTTTASATAALSIASAEFANKKRRLEPDLTTGVGRPDYAKLKQLVKGLSPHVLETHRTQAVAELKAAEDAKADADFALGKARGVQEHRAHVHVHSTALLAEMSEQLQPTPDTLSILRDVMLSSAKSFLDGVSKLRDRILSVSTTAQSQADDELLQSHAKAVEQLRDAKGKLAVLQRLKRAKLLLLQRAEQQQNSQELRDALEKSDRRVAAVERLCAECFHAAREDNWDFIFKPEAQLGN